MGWIRVIITLSRIGGKDKENSTLFSSGAHLHNLSCVLRVSFLKWYKIEIDFLHVMLGGGRVVAAGARGYGQRWVRTRIVLAKPTQNIY